MVVSEVTIVFFLRIDLVWIASYYYESYTTFIGLFLGELSFFSSLVLRFFGFLKKKSSCSFFLISYSVCSINLYKKLCFQLFSAFFIFLVTSCITKSNCYFSIVSSNNSISLFSSLCCFLFFFWGSVSLKIVDLS
jgi:hypothetical protein